jgi:hypothetical protein
MNTLYALLENGQIHTDNLKLDDANEMLERHSRIFDTIQWDVVPMAEIKNREKLVGFLERHRQNAVRYHSEK